MKKIILVMTMMIFAACGKPQEKKIEKKEAVKSVKTAKLEKTVMDNTKNYNGELIPLNEVTHITDTGGDVLKVNYKNGDSVKKGDVILILKDVDTKSAYLESHGELIKAQSDYDTNKISCEKYKTLFDKKLISEDAFLTVKNQLLQSEGELEIAKSSYIQTKEDYDDLTVRAKIAGLITDLDVKLYEKTSPDQNLFTVVDDSEMELGVGLSTEDLGNIGVGNNADIYIDGIKLSLNGTVEKINPASDSDTKKYEAKILVDNNEKKLFKGMYAKVKINSGEVEGFFVPKEAVMIKDMYNYIAVSRNDKAVIYKVELGISTDEFQQIYFDAYEEGDRIVIQGQYLLKNNDKLKEA